LAELQQMKHVILNWRCGMNGGVDILCYSGLVQTQMRKILVLIIIWRTYCSW